VQHWCQWVGSCVHYIYPWWSATTNSSHQFQITPQTLTMEKPHLLRIRALSNFFTNCKFTQIS
jgi:hypothetical protein